MKDSDGDGVLDHLDDGDDDGILDDQEDSDNINDGLPDSDDGDVISSHSLSS